ncbi:MAG: FhaA domain-containing protein [Acidimicrobiia bacterium]
MKVARSLERRLERLLEGVFSRVFSGRLHASEIAGRIAREADLARFEHESGPGTANSYTLTFNPGDIDGTDSELEASLTRSFAEYAAEAGLRLVGPPRVAIVTDENVVTGQFLCHPEIVPGPEPAWARLVGDQGTLEVCPNRAILGRSDQADVRIAVPEVSRSHALLWRSGGTAWLKDLGSANGTVVDGRRVDSSQVELSTGSVLQLANARFRFVKAADA